MKILITGGCGFIGMNLVKDLITRKSECIYIVDNLSNSNLENFEKMLSSLLAFQKTHKKCDKSKKDVIEYFVFNTKVVIYIADISEKNIANNVCSKVDSVVHLAGQTSVQPSLVDPVNDFEHNIVGSFNYLEACRSNDVKKFIVASSAAVLGNSNPPQSENLPYRPLSPYGASKSAIEAYCSAYYLSYGVGAIALRFSNVYGPYAWNKGSAVAVFTKKMINKERVVINGSGKQTRDFLHVENIVNTIVDIIYDKNNIKYCYGIPLNIATGVLTSINNIVESISSCFNYKIDIIHGPKLDGDVSTSSPSIDSLSKFVDVDNFFKLKDKLTETIGWFKSNL